MPVLKGTPFDRPEIRDYLRELEKALAVLPVFEARELRDQIATHLGDALSVDADDEEIAAVLHMLGSPVDVVAEASSQSASTLPATTTRKRHHFGVPRMGWRGWVVAAMAVALAGSAIG